MCVIIHCKKNRPSLEILQACQTANTAGGGFAWFDADGKVHWLKGLGAEQIHAELKEKPLPVVIHFRLATVGGTGAALCHPFPISPKAELFEAGVIDNKAGVLFHNGHVGEWELLLLAAGMERLAGATSDTRAIAAVLSNHKNLKMLDKLAGVYAVMREGKVFKFGTWVKDSGLSFSNLHWKWRSTATGYTGSSRNYWQDENRFDAMVQNGSAVRAEINGVFRVIHKDGTYWNGSVWMQVPEGEYARLGKLLKFANPPKGCPVPDEKPGTGVWVSRNGDGSASFGHTGGGPVMAGFGLDHALICRCADCKREMAKAKSTHELFCHCRACDKNRAELAKLQTAPEQAEQDMADRYCDEIERLHQAGINAPAPEPVKGHDPDCMCFDCQRNRNNPKPAPEPHGEDCRCGDCRSTSLALARKAQQEADERVRLEMAEMGHRRNGID